MYIKDVKNIYFLAICGTAMASLAAMMKQKGYNVYGSDSGIYPPMSTFLEEQGIKIIQGFDVKNLSPKPDLVVVGNAISRGNVEIEKILNDHIPYISLPDAIREFFIRGKRSIVVTGTHGKTTTTSLLSWIFHYADKKPGFLIGGIPNNFSRGFQLGDGNDFIIEGDEYDSAFFDKASKFLRYMPDIAVINGIEFDHADIYDSLDQIKLSFQRMINLIPQNGCLIVNSENETAVELSKKAFCSVQTFGILAKADWMAADIQFIENGVTFSVIHNDKELDTVEFTLRGNHNIRNALAAIAVSRTCGIDWQTIRDALKHFKGVKRRLELKAEKNNIKIYDDFGHHPTAIQETLSALRNQYKENTIWALFEPRTATTRRNIFQNELVPAFKDADKILVPPVDRPEKVPAGQLFSCEQFVKALKEQQKFAQLFGSVDEIVNFLKTRLQKGDIVVTFSNGPFGNIHQKLIDLL